MYIYLFICLFVHFQLLADECSFLPTVLMFISRVWNRESRDTHITAGFEVWIWELRQSQARGSFCKGTFPKAALSSGQGGSDSCPFLPGFPLSKHLELLSKSSPGRQEFALCTSNWKATKGIAAYWEDQKGDTKHKRRQRNGDHSPSHTATLSQDPGTQAEDLVPKPGDSSGLRH